MSSPNTAKDAAHLLEEDHAELDESLSGILAALDAGNLQEAYARLDLFWARLAIHIRAEHLRLFPAVLDALPRNAAGRAGVDLSSTEVSDLTERLRSDHDFFMRELARAVNALREVLPPSSDHEAAATRLRDVRRKSTVISCRLTEHNRLEEEKFYRWSAKFLSAMEQARLADGVRRELSNLPPRF